MKSSLEIAQEAELRPIEEIAEACGLEPDEIDPYGRYKAKISLGVTERLADRPDGKIICVAGMTPTKAGEGKTTTLVGLTSPACANPRSAPCSASRAAPRAVA
jgi:formate--tetrahydrofolate ligase